MDKQGEICQSSSSPLEIPNLIVQVIIKHRHAARESRIMHRSYQKLETSRQIDESPGTKKKKKSDKSPSRRREGRGCNFGIGERLCHSVNIRTVNTLCPVYFYNVWFPANREWRFVGRPIWFPAVIHLYGRLLDTFQLMLPLHTAWRNKQFCIFSLDFRRSRDFLNDRPKPEISIRGNEF